MNNLPRWRWFLPLVFFHLHLPLLEIRTALMGQSYDTMEREYLALQIRFIKWSFSFALYDTARRVRERAIPWSEEDNR